MTAISVIIPVYNVEKYLRRCLDSLLGQTFTDWEAICVNDGSPDNCAQILSEYATRDPRFTVINKENGGVSDARNTGLVVAKGRYIHFMDSDDFVDSDFYQTVFDAAQKYNVDILCTGFLTDNQYARNILYKKHRVLTTMKQKVFYTFMFTDCFIWRYLFKKDFLDKNNLRFNTNFTAQEDTLFLLDVVEKADSIVIVPGTNYHYMFNDMSLLNNRDIEHHKKVKQNYYQAKSIKKNFAKRHNLLFLWNFRKLWATLKRSF